MEQLILVIHVITAAAIIALILLQQGKGAEAGASFGGGASQTVFGSGGSGNFFTKATSVFATLFFVTSFGLAIVAKNKSAVEGDSDIPALVEMKKDAIESEIPVVEEAEVSVESAVPVVEEEINSISEQAIEEVSVPAVDTAGQ